MLRIRHAPTPAELEAIRQDKMFQKFLVGGTFHVRTAAEAERDPEIVPHMPRLCFQFDRRSMAYLRLLIDRLNSLPSLPPLTGPTRVPDVGSDQPDRMVGEMAEEEGIKLAGG